MKVGNDLIEDDRELGIDGVESAVDDAVVDCADAGGRAELRLVYDLLRDKGGSADRSADESSLSLQRPRAGSDTFLASGRAESFLLIDVYHRPDITMCTE